MRETVKAKLSYNNAKRIAKRVVWLAKSEAKKTNFNSHICQREWVSST